MLEVYAHWTTHRYIILSMILAFRFKFSHNWYFSRDLTNVDLLSRMIHLRFVDLSQNMLSDISCLSNLTHLMMLKCEQNLLTSLRLESLPYLQYLNMNNNKITSLDGVNHPLLEILSVNCEAKFYEISNFEYSTLWFLHLCNYTEYPGVYVNGICYKLSNLTFNSVFTCFHYCKITKARQLYLRAKNKQFLCKMHTV